MLEVHSTYNKERFEKLNGMFGGDPRQGNATLYVREHFNRKRVCESCGMRTSAQRLAVPSAIVEGHSWVLPISVTRGGDIVLDLADSIPDQSNFLNHDVIDELVALNVNYNSQGSTGYAIPLSANRDSHIKTIEGRIYEGYERIQSDFTCYVTEHAAPADVLTWDTEVEYEWQGYVAAATGERRCGYNVESQYFQWLAEKGLLKVFRIRNSHDVTLAIAYAVLSDFELSFISAKHRVSGDYRAYSFDNALVLMMLDYLYDQELRVPLSLGSVLGPGEYERWHPIPVVKPALEFSNRLARQTFIDCFGST